MEKKHFFQLKIICYAFLINFPLYQFLEDFKWIEVEKSSKANYQSRNLIF